MGIKFNTMEKWSKHLPPLPITRQYIERWLREREDRKHLSERNMIRVLEMRAAGISNVVIRKKLGLDTPETAYLWKQGIKEYENLKRRNLLPSLPSDVNTVIRCWNTSVAQRKRDTYWSRRKKESAS